MQRNWNYLCIYYSYFSSAIERDQPQLIQNCKTCSSCKICRGQLAWAPPGGVNLFAFTVAQLFRSFISIVQLGVLICWVDEAAPHLHWHCCFTFAVGVVHGEHFSCIDIFFVAYQSCGCGSILPWMKNGCAATVVIGKGFPFHLILNTRTKFFRNKLHEDIIIPKSKGPWRSKSLCLLICPGDGSSLQRNRVQRNSGTPAMSAIQVYLCIPTLQYQFQFYSLLTNMHPNVNIFLN